MENKQKTTETIITPNEVSLLGQFKKTPQQVAKDHIKIAKYNILAKKGVHIGLNQTTRAFEIDVLEQEGIHRNTIKLALFTDTQLKKSLMDKQ